MPRITADDETFGGIADNLLHTIRLTIFRNLAGEAEVVMVLDEGTAGEKGMSGTHSTDPYFTFNEIAFSSNDDDIDYIIDNVVVEFSEIENLPPEVDAGRDRGVDVGAVLVLDATVTDPEDDALTYAWTAKGPGTATFNDAAIQDPNVTFNAGGIYTLTLTVTDSFANEASDSLDVSVHDPADDALLALWDF